MFYAIPYFGLEVFHIAGIPPVITLIIIAKILGIIVLLVEGYRLKLRLRTILVLFFLFQIIYEFFTRSLYFISHIFMHKDLTIEAFIQKLSDVNIVASFFVPPSILGPILIVKNNFNLEPLQGQIGGRIYFGLLAATIIMPLIATYITRERGNIRKYYDAFFLAHVIELLFNRVANLSTHYHIGKETTFFLGMHYGGKIRHETALYSVASLTILFAISWFLRKKIDIPGLLALIILCWICLSRVTFDFFRRNDAGMNYQVLGSLTLNQLVYFLIFAISFFLIYRMAKTQKR